MRTQRNLGALVAIAAASLVLVGCSGGSGTSGYSYGPPNAQSDTNGASSSSGEGISATATPFGADLATVAFSISWRDAVDIAQEQFDGGVTEVELDWNIDRYAYKVELASSTEEYEARIDADTGEKLSESAEPIDAEDLAPKPAEVIELGQVKSWEDALSAALVAQAGTVDEWKLEGKVEGPQYEFDIVDDSGNDFDVIVDAMTGSVLRVED